MSAKAPSKVSIIVVKKPNQADEIEDTMFDDMTQIKVGITAKQVRQGSVAKDLLESLPQPVG